MDQVYMRVCKSVSACSEFICVCGDVVGVYAWIKFICEYVKVCVMLWVYMHGSSYMRVCKVCVMLWVYMHGSSLYEELFSKTL